MGNDVAIGAKVDEETKKKIRIAAAMHNMTMSEYLRKAVIQQLEDEEEGNFQSMAMSALS